MTNARSGYEIENNNIEVFFYTRNIQENEKGRERKREKGRKKDGKKEGKEDDFWLSEGLY